MSIKKLYIFITAIAMLFLAFTAFFSKAPVNSMLDGNRNLINFSHELHSELAECAECHSSVEESTSLKDRLLPDHDNCGDCHEVDNEEECSTCHIDDTYEALIQTESELIFSHKQHIEQELECAACHKDFTVIDYSDEAEQKIPPMEVCASCHSPVAEGPEFCESCHISTANLIPQNHITNNFNREHKFLARSFDANCAMCHDNSTCEECHISTNVITELNTPDDFFQPYVPSQGTDGPKQQIIERVHELDYRFIHGIDANLKSQECQSCHEIQSFCANCHQSEIADFSLGGVTPLSHIDPGFKTIGVGSSGGEHAILARRDIESCTACHDIQGADPSCIICHLDSDGIKGTDPKTHAAGFMNDLNGDWHNDMGSICYNCHTSASPQSSKSSGFCNYCHGL
jgi:hypothetical protein